jgi:SAM-dependent methyltransferase
VDEAELKTRRALSFGTAAESYAQHRPSYPDEAVAWALEPVLDRRIVRVLDLGAGTGRLTEALLRAAVDVIAVEPDPAMRAQLVRRVRGVAVLDGAAEHIPLPDQRVDAVVVGQAFHWFDAARAFPEIARVLKPGGVLAAMWNGDDLRVPWVAGLAERAGVGGNRSAAETVFDHPAFESAQWASFDHAHRRTVDSLVQTIGTYSALLVLPPDERHERLRRVREFLERQPETTEGEFDLPLVTRVVRAVRR